MLTVHCMHVGGLVGGHTQTSVRLSMNDPTGKQKHGAAVLSGRWGPGSLREWPVCVIVMVRGVGLASCLARFPHAA
jgi:hypothetical protein